MILMGNQLAYGTAGLDTEGAIGYVFDH